MGMVEEGCRHCLTGRNVGSAGVVDYPQEGGNVNGNALTHLPIHQGAAPVF